MRTAQELAQASEARADAHLHWADRAYGLGQMFRDSTADRRGDFGRANAAASRAFWAAGDAHWAAADAHEVSQACNSGDDPQQDEFEFAMEASHYAKRAFAAAVRAGKATKGTDAIGMVTEIDAENAAEEAARLVREAENVAERCLNGS